MPVIFNASTMTFVQTLNPFFCFHWLTFTTSVTTYNTLDQDTVSVWDISVQSSVIPGVEDIDVLLLLFVCFSV